MINKKTTYKNPYFYIFDYTEEEIATFIEMVLKGLIFLHDLNIIHRDKNKNNQ